MIDVVTSFLSVDDNIRWDAVTSSAQPKSHIFLRLLFSELIDLLLSVGNVGTLWLVRVTEHPYFGASCNILAGENTISTQLALLFVCFDEVRHDK